MYPVGRSSKLTETRLNKYRLFNPWATVVYTAVINSYTSTSAVDIASDL